MLLVALGSCYEVFCAMSASPAIFVLFKCDFQHGTVAILRCRGQPPARHAQHRFPALRSWDCTRLESPHSLLGCIARAQTLPHASFNCLAAVCPAMEATVDASTLHPRDTAQTETAEQRAAPTELLALPPPPPPSGSSGSCSGTAPQAGPSQTLQMDHLGPMVVGADGSISRIANWDKLTQREQEVRGQRARRCLPGPACRRPM